MAAEMQEMGRRTESQLRRLPRDRLQPLEWANLPRSLRARQLPPQPIFRPASHTVSVTTCLLTLLLLMLLLLFLLLVYPLRLRLS